MAILLFLRRVTFAWGTPGGLDLWEPPGCWFLSAYLYQEALFPAVQNFRSVAQRSTGASSQWLLLEVVAFVLKPSLGPCCGPRRALQSLLGASYLTLHEVLLPLGSEGFLSPNSSFSLGTLASLRDLVLQAFNRKLLPPVLNLPPGKWGL